MKRHCTLSQWLCHTNNGWGRTATNILTNQTSSSKIKHQSLFLKLIAWVIAVLQRAFLLQSHQRFMVSLGHFSFLTFHIQMNSHWSQRSECCLPEGSTLGVLYLQGCPASPGVTGQVDRAVRRWPVAMMLWAEEDFTSHARDLGPGGFVLYFTMGQSLAFLSLPW